MKTSEFLTLITKNEGDLWWPGKTLAEEFQLHLREEEEVLAWLHDSPRVLENEKREQAQREQSRSQGGWFGEESRRRTTIVLTRPRMFLLARLLSQGQTNLQISSTPLGRLRSVQTRLYQPEKKSPWGGLFLDFAGSVLGAIDEPSTSHYTFRHELGAGWPSKELAAFLQALYEAWR